MAAAQVADEGADPRDRGRADQDRRAARDPPRRRSPSPTPAIPQFVDRFPYEETDDQDRAIADVLAGPRGRQADGPAGVRRRRLRQDRGRAARRLRHGDVGQAGRADLPDHPARAPALHELRRAASRLPDQDRPAVAAGARGRGEEDQGRPRRRHRSTSSSAPTRSSPRASSSSASASSSSTRSSISESPTRSG